MSVCVCVCVCLFLFYYFFNLARSPFEVQEQLRNNTAFNFAISLLILGSDWVNFINENGCQWFFYPPQMLYGDLTMTFLASFEMLLTAHTVRKLTISLLTIRNKYQTDERGDKSNGYKSNALPVITLVLIQLWKVQKVLILWVASSTFWTLRQTKIISYPNSTNEDNAVSKPIHIFPI